jgi:hypothetical protein
MSRRIKKKKVARKVGPMAVQSDNVLALNWYMSSRYNRGRKTVGPVERAVLGAQTCLPFMSRKDLRDGGGL